MEETQSKVLFDFENKIVEIHSDKGSYNLTTKLSFDYILEMAKKIEEDKCKNG